MFICNTKCTKMFKLKNTYIKGVGEGPFFSTKHVLQEKLSRPVENSRIFIIFFLL